MGRMFQKAPRKGEPISRRGLANGLAAIDYALTHMRVENGRVVWSALGAPTLMFGDDGAGASPAMIETIKANSLPAGGDQYQVLEKASGDDGDVAWGWLKYKVPS